MRIPFTRTFGHQPPPVRDRMAGEPMLPRMRSGHFTQHAHDPDFSDCSACDEMAAMLERRRAAGLTDLVCVHPDDAVE